MVAAEEIRSEGATIEVEDEVAVEHVETKVEAKILVENVMSRTHHGTAVELTGFMLKTPLSASHRPHAHSKTRSSQKPEEEARKKKLQKSQIKR